MPLASDQNGSFIAYLMAIFLLVRMEETPAAAATAAIPSTTTNDVEDLAAVFVNVVVFL
jgi:hypothetical protein